MADTGRTVWADGLWADDVWAVGLWATDEAVIVPDVDDPGTTQAAATAAIEGVGLVVAVLTAYSSSIPAGEVISQDPAAGSQVIPGSTVTITVSLGESQSFTGGIEHAFEAERQRRKKERKRLEDLKAEAEQIQDETTRNIARLMREQEAKDARKAELSRLQAIVDRHKDRTEITNERIQKAVQKAATRQTAYALFALERELERAREEEDFLWKALRAALD